MFVPYGGDAGAFSYLLSLFDASPPGEVALLERSGLK